MKTLKIFAAGLMLAMSCAVQAQINISVNITPPDWGPDEASGVKFYFMPDIQVYYDVTSKVFIYRSGTTWVRTATLPGRYGTFNLYTGYKVMLHDDDDRPYEHFDEHCKKYPKGYGRGEHQKTWKDGHHDNGHHYGEKKHDEDHDGDHDNGNHGHGHGHGHGHDKDDDH